jgi:hypothetical protein
MQSTVRFPRMTLYHLLSIIVFGPPFHQSSMRASFRLITLIKTGFIYINQNNTSRRCGSLSQYILQLVGRTEIWGRRLWLACLLTVYTYAGNFMHHHACRYFLILSNFTPWYCYLVRYAVVLVKYWPSVFYFWSRKLTTQISTSQLQILLPLTGFVYQLHLEMSRKLVFLTLFIFLGLSAGGPVSTLITDASSADTKYLITL